MAASLAAALAAFCSIFCRFFSSATICFSIFCAANSAERWACLRFFSADVAVILSPDGAQTDWEGLKGITSTKQNEPYHNYIYILEYFIKRYRVIFESIYGGWYILCNLW